MHDISVLNKNLKLYKGICYIHTVYIQFRWYINNEA